MPGHSSLQLGAGGPRALSPQIPQQWVRLPLPLCPCCQDRTRTRPLCHAPTPHTQDGFNSSCAPSTPPSRAWGRVLPGGLTPSPGTRDATRAMAPSLCRQLCRGASATGGSLIIDGQVSRQGGCSAIPAGLCLPSADNPGPGTAGRSRRDISGLGARGFAQHHSPAGKGHGAALGPRCHQQLPCSALLLGLGTHRGTPCCHGHSAVVGSRL